MLVQEKLEEKNIPCARGIYMPRAPPFQVSPSWGIYLPWAPHSEFLLSSLSVIHWRCRRRVNNQKKSKKKNLLTCRWGSGVWLSSLHADMSQWWCGGAGDAMLSSTVVVVGVSGAVTVIGEGDRGKKERREVQLHKVNTITWCRSFNELRKLSNF